VNTLNTILAFPSVHEGDRIEPGMSLRDYFAGRAMVGILAGAARSAFNDSGIAEWAYRLADAMLAARQNGGAA
jgi:hypothetical protein